MMTFYLLIYPYTVGFCILFTSVILFVTDEATIKAKRFICILKESRVTLPFVVKSKLVTGFITFPIYTLTVTPCSGGAVALR